MDPISLLQIEVCHAKSNRHLASLSEISSKSTIKDVKEAIGLAKRKYADINRQELRLEPKGKFLKDEVTLEDLGLNTGEFDIAQRVSRYCPSLCFTHNVQNSFYKYCSSI